MEEIYKGYEIVARTAASLDGVGWTPVFTISNERGAIVHEGHVEGPFEYDEAFPAAAAAARQWIDQQTS